jgi:hypothetical protein
VGLRFGVLLRAVIVRISTSHSIQATGQARIWQHTRRPQDGRLPSLLLSLGNHLINLGPHVLHRLDSSTGHINLLPVDGSSILTARIHDKREYGSPIGTR